MSFLSLVALPHISPMKVEIISTYQTKFSWNSTASIAFELDIRPNVIESRDPEIVQVSGCRYSFSYTYSSDMPLTVGITVTVKSLTAYKGEDGIADSTYIFETCE